MKRLLLFILFAVSINTIVNAQTNDSTQAVANLQINSHPGACMNVYAWFNKKEASIPNFW